MTKQVTFEGRQYSFPDDATPDEIGQALESVHASPQRQRPTPEYQRAYQREQRQYGQAGGTDNTMGNLGGYITHNLGVDDELAAGGAYLSQGARNLVRRGLGMPIDVHAGVAAQAAADFAKQRGDTLAQQHPGWNAAGIAAGVAGSAGAPSAIAAAPMSMLRAGGTAAAVDAPFALARQEGSLPERLPGAAQEMAATGAFGAWLQGLANVIAPATLPRAARMARAMEQAGVDPSHAAVNAGTFGGTMSGALTNTIADNPVAGMLVRPRIGRQLEQAAQESRRIQAGYGQVRSPEAAGGVVQRAVRRYASDRNQPNPAPHADPRTVLTSEWSVPAQADAIFDHVLRPVEGNTTNLNRTVQAIQDIERLGNNDPTVLAFRRDGVLRDISEAAHDLYTRPTQGQHAMQPLTLRAARELRRRLRIEMDAPQLAGGQDNASLQRVYSALTNDIYDAAGPAANNLRKADQFYRQHMDRIANRLQAFDPHATDPSQSFQAIIRAAQRKTGNVRDLVALRSSIRDNEWRTVAASLINEMGQPVGGAGGTQAAELGFSVNTFSTAWRNMTPQARRVLFGSSRSRLAQELDNLATVVNQLKGVERTTNNSGSGRYANVALTAGGAVANLPATVGALAGLSITGEALTNPAFVRWLVSASRNGATVGGARQQLAALAQIARRDPAIAPIYADLARRAGEHFLPHTEQQPQRRELVQ